MNKLLNKSTMREIILLCGLLTAGGYLAYVNCMRGIDIHLMSITADGGYRIFLGQVPYSDFHLHTGPVLYYLQGLFFKIYGGFFWHAMALHAAAISVLASLIIYMILRSYLGTLEAFFFTGISLLTYSLPRGYPWVEPICFLFYLIALGIFFFASRYSYNLKSSVLNLLAALSGLALTVVLFTKHNIGFSTLAFTAPLWFLIPFSETEKLRDRFVRFLSCSLFFLFSTMVLMLYFNSHGNFFFKDILGSTGALKRLYYLLPTYAIKDWLSYHYGYTVILVYFTIPALIIAFGYLSNVKLKQILQEKFLIGVIISMTFMNYVAHFTSETGSHTALGLFSLYLGLIYALLSKLQSRYYHLEIDKKKFLKFCLIATFVAILTVLIFRVPVLTGIMPEFIRSRRITLLINFPLFLVIFSAVFFLVLWILNRRSERAFFCSATNYFTGFKLYVVLISISSVTFFASFSYLNSNGLPWKLIPGLHGVEFRDIPAFKDVYSDNNTVSTVEDIVEWFRPKIDKNPLLKKGSEIYILGLGQSLYGLLGVESFKGVHLYLQYGLTYSRTDPDPDTNTIINKAPEFIIYYQVDRSLRDLNIFLEHAPKLKEFIQQYYRAVAQFNEIVVLQHVSKLST